MNLKKIEKVGALLNFIAGICFLLAGFLSEDYFFLPIGICFTVIGIINLFNKNKNKK